MLERIVVPIDASDASLAALGPARKLADSIGGELVAVTVVAKPGDRGRAETEIDQRVASFGVPVDRTEVTVNGYTIGQGLEVVTHQPEVLVVMATETHSRNLAITGSVAEELVHARPDALTILVGPGTDVDGFDPSGPVVACVDPERPSARVRAFARRLAGELSTEAIEVSVVIEEAASAGPRTHGGSPNRSDRPHRAPRSDRSVGSTLRTVVGHGSDPAASIVEFGDRVGASILAVGTRPRVGLSRMVFGSVAIETVRTAHCPVLAVSDVA